LEKKPIRLLVFSSRGSGTGCALRARYIARAFQKKGHPSFFVEPIPSLPFWFDMILSAFYYSWISLWRSCDAVLLIKPYPTAVPALWIQRFKGAKVVIDVDDLDFDYSRGAFRSFHRWLQKPWPAWADLVTYHNPNLLEPLRRLFRVPPSRLVPLGQGVDRELFHPGKPEKADLPDQAAALLPPKGRGPLLVFTAHLNVACDLEPILDSFRLVRRSLPQARLLVAGGGPDEGRFRRLSLDLGLSDSVRFTGGVTPRQVAACLRAADAALVYYRKSPVNRYRASMKLREAMACGCRVVATSIGEAAQWKKALFLSEPDPRAFAETVLRALKARKSPKEGAILVKDWDHCVEPLEKELS
jgi:glycosyltransferase involved in cell wall biosynthesis